MLRLSEYVKANNVEEAYELLKEDNNNHIIGGGAWIKLSLKSANKLISLENLDLNDISIKDDILEIGSLVTLNEIENSPLIKSLCDGILSNAISSIMGINVRNIATIGGSIMGKFAFSDIFPVLAVLKTKLVFYKQGEICFNDYLNSKNHQKDILLKIKIKNQEGSGFFKKVAITPLDFSIINIACSYIDKELHISVGATPYIANSPKNAIEYFNNLKSINDENINNCAKLALSELKFSSNLRGSEEYRKELAKVYITRGIKQVTNYVD